MRFSATGAATRVELDDLHGSDDAGPSGRPRGRLAGARLRLGSGVHAVLGAPADGTFALGSLLSGKLRPSRGTVRVASADPFTSAPLRARIGSLGALPALPRAPTVAACVGLALTARGEARDRFDAVLDPLSLGALHARRPASLSHAEARSVELALALSTPDPALVVLHEPLTDVGAADGVATRRLLRELADGGACVVVITSSPGEASALGDVVHHLRAGLFTGVVSDAEAPHLSGLGAELVVWVREPDGTDSSGVRGLAAELGRCPEITGLSWDRGGRAGYAGLRLRCTDREAGALALVDAAVKLGCIIEAVAQTSSGLLDLRAASDALAARNRRPRLASPSTGPERPSPTALGPATGDGRLGEGG